MIVYDLGADFIFLSFVAVHTVVRFIEEELNISFVQLEHKIWHIDALGPLSARGPMDRLGQT